MRVEQTEVAALDRRRHQPSGGAKPIGSPGVVAELSPASPALPPLHTDPATLA